jgi:hypothetical protein
MRKYPKRDRKVNNPIKYWWELRFDYPRLLRFAINIFSTLAISDKLERVFSVTSNMVRPNRAKLKADIIGAVISLKH